MNAFVKIHRDASMAMAQRNMLLAQPPTYFSEFFNGRIPSLHERLAWIEQQVVRVISWEIYRNDDYEVMIERDAPFIHMCIRRRDGEPCKDWRDHQRIKNELIGPEYEAVELFPAESRLVDTANEYHLWAHPSPKYRFPFGFTVNRCVVERQLTFEGARHEALPDANAPERAEPARN